MPMTDEVKALMDGIQFLVPAEKVFGPEYVIHRPVRAVIDPVEFVNLQLPPAYDPADPPRVWIVNGLWRFNGCGWEQIDAGEADGTEYRLEWDRGTADANRSEFFHDFKPRKGWDDGQVAKGPKKAPKKGRGNTGGTEGAPEEGFPPELGGEA